MTLTVPGATDRFISAFADTVRAAVALTLPTEAVTVVEPIATPSASPTELIDAAATLELAQVAVEVTSPVDPSLKVAVAVNCWFSPAGMLAVAGVTAMPVMAFAVTVNGALPVTPLIEAVTVAVPGATAAASPPAVMVAIEVLELDHAADEVTSAVDPLL